MPVPARILHLIDSLDLGGAQVVLLNLLRHADRQRFHHEAACLHGRGVFWRRLAETGTPLSTLSFHHFFPSYVPLLLWRFLARRYDILHCHLLGANVIAKPLAALCRLPIRINHDHCNDKLTDPRRWTLPADRWANRFSTHVIAVSESTRQFVVQHEGVAEARATTIHNGIDCDHYRPRLAQRAAARAQFGLPADALIVGGLGRLTYQKNFQLFLQVAAQVLRRNPTAFFALAGTGEDEASLRQLASELGLQQRVRFLGYVPETADLYPALDLLLLTSRYEGLPITILEAMATGTPIVASRLDGIAEVLHDGAEALLLPPGEPAPFAEAVSALLENPARAREQADRALAKVRAEYSAQLMARRVEAIYDRCLPPSKR